MTLIVEENGKYICKGCGYTAKYFFKECPSDCDELEDDFHVMNSDDDPLGEQQHIDQLGFSASEDD